MTWTIARKEFLTSLLTYRFSVSVSATVLLMSLSAWGLAADYARRVEVHRAEVAREESRLASTRVYAVLQAYTHRPPSPLSIISQGLDRRLGNVLRFSHSHVPTLLGWPKESSPLLDAFPPFDLATIAALLFSLVALFLAYDAICGEQEAGTLKLMAAHAVGRHQILVGKWLGGMACTALPAVTGFLVALLVVTSAQELTFTADEWMAAVLVVAAALVYTSLFYLAGLWLSARTRLPSTSLMLCILVWTLTTVLLPTCSAYLIAETLPMRTEEQAREARQEAEKRFQQEFDIHALTEKGLGATYTFSGGLPVGDYIWGAGLFRDVIEELQGFYAEVEPRRISAAEEIARLEDQVSADRIAQVEMSRRIARWFIAPAFSSAAAALAGTDLDAFQAFVRHARRCRQSLVAHLRDSGLFASPLFFTQDDVSQALTRREADERWKRGEQVPSPRTEAWGPLDLSGLPPCPPYRADPLEEMSRAAVDLAVLGLANVVVLLLALRAFLRRPLS
ncbi:MAG: ABC transporter permease subunit [Candidatus Latescibacterota bacterium]